MHKHYIDKTNEILAEEYGIGTGTLAYRQINKQELMMSLVMMDLIKELQVFNENFSKLNEQEEKTKKTTKK